MTTINRRAFILLASAAIAGCKRRAVQTPVPVAGEPAPQTKPAFAGAASPEELKKLFLERYNKNDVDGVMELFYLKGASQNMIDLYRTAATRDPDEQIASAEITDLPTDDHETSVHTLTPEKRLVLKFQPPAQPKELNSVEQFFYIGRHDGKYFLTLPTGE